MLKRIVLLLALAAVVMAACQPVPTPPPPTPTPEPAAAVDGRLVPPAPGAVVEGIPVALCRVSASGGSCELRGPASYTGAAGEFRFEDVQPGAYLLVYGSGAGDFEAALARWAGALLRPGDWPWLRDELLSLEDGAQPEVHVPAQVARDLLLDRGAYGTLTLQAGESPFVVAHDIRTADGSAQAELHVVQVPPGETAAVTVTAYRPAPPDYAAERAGIGPLSRDELALVDRSLSARWAAFMAGDDAAYRALDAHTIALVRAGRLHEIGNAYFTTVQRADDVLLDAPAYTTIDPRSGEHVFLGWLDEATGDVVEQATGYRLNVRDRPGEWTELGAGGERFYHYGFSYYRRWGQLLPDPFIALAESFYAGGVRHVDRNINDYRSVAGTFKGDLRQVAWFPNVLLDMAAWQPVTAPFVRLPDSGTVDIRRERFREAVDGGYVVLDQESVDTFMLSSSAASGAFTGGLERQQVVDALLTPYYSGALFSDMEAAIILQATYGGGSTTPLTIRISRGLEQGFMVPRYREKQVLVSPNEVANVILGYPGALNSRWAHELWHVVDFNAPQYTFRGPPEQGSRCEPGKYLLEFMWWVQRYPGDAPDWDWMPINSGLALARLLTEKYHNSRC